ncbi:MAG TPA: stage II sporulation protein M [archaeon]|nr:stage II sporulation protein M [archaeon]
MIVEEILKRFWDVKSKNNLFFLGIIMGFIGFVIGWLLFPGKLLPGVFFTAMPLVPFVHKIYKKRISSRNMALLYIYIFFGMIFVFTFLYSVAPTEKIVEFGTYENISAQDPYMAFSYILSNNTKLIFICLLLSMMYGIGSIFILTLNSAVIGQMFSHFLTSGKLDLLFAFMPHTVIEITAYMLAALAGGVLAASFINIKDLRKKSEKKEFEKKVLKSATFFTISITVVIIGAFVESFVMPLLV